MLVIPDACIIAHDIGALFAGFIPTGSDVIVRSGEIYLLSV